MLRTACPFDRRLAALPCWQIVRYLGPPRNAGPRSVFRIAGDESKKKKTRGSR